MADSKTAGDCRTTMRGIHKRGTMLQDCELGSNKGNLHGVSQRSAHPPKLPARMTCLGVRLGRNSGWSENTSRPAAEKCCGQTSVGCFSETAACRSGVGCTHQQLCRQAS